MNDQAGNLQWTGVDKRRFYPTDANPEIVHDQDVSPAAPLTPIRPRSGYIFSKRSLDIVGTLVLAAAFSPIMLLVALALHRRAGAVVVGHRRIGKNGKEFKAYKFRTMLPDADRLLRELQIQHPETFQQWMQEHDLRNDPRMTNLGKLLRRTNLDRLPMLWNVLKGQMSLVGPKPIIREELRKYGTSARYYLAQKPGLTGLWQVTGRNSRDYRSRIAMDRRYALNASLWFDLIVLFKTVALVLSSHRGPRKEIQDPLTLLAGGGGQDLDGLECVDLSHQE